MAAVSAAPMRRMCQAVSHVTNVVILCSLGEQYQEDGPIPAIEHIHKTLGLRPLKRIENVGGDMALEAMLWVGAYNYLDLSGFLLAFDTAPWFAIEDAQLLVQEQNDVRFTMLRSPQWE